MASMLFFGSTGGDTENTCRKLKPACCALAAMRSAKLPPSEKPQRMNDLPANCFCMDCMASTTSSIRQE